MRQGLVLGAMVVALGLAGCGRKGPLEPPPAAAASTSSQQAAQPAAQQGPGFTSFQANRADEPLSQRTVTGERAGIAADGRPIAPIGEKRRIPLDALID
ncbi:MAG: lipoprotein [Pseudolabrys sp.]|nr:lipoprotein [Pseudolabrys sp.]